MFDTNSSTYGKLKLRKLPLLLLGIGCVFGAHAAEQDRTSGGLTSLLGLSDNAFTYGGFVRTWASMNLQNHPEVSGGAGQLQMLRGSVELDTSLKTGPLTWTVVGRSDREILTGYEKDLQDLARRYTPGGPGSSLLSQYDQDEIREFYVDADVGRRVHLRLGKQQIVWGETDFFHPTDLIQGYDYRWRSFVEPESDELRKPLITANAKIDVPEANGSLQLVLRPGVDRKRDIGNTYDLYGGRWMQEPFKGTDFLATATHYDYNHPAGNVNVPTGGLRWTGEAGPVGFALSYLNTFNPDPVLNPAANPYKKTPSGGLGDWFYPKIDVFAASANGEITAIDAVVTAEVAYQLHKLYNTGTGLPNLTQGTGPVVSKNVIESTLRIDKQLRLESLLGTNAPSLFSVQLFDTWIQNFHSSDDIVAQVGWSAPAKQHDTILTAFLTLNYLSNRINPGIAGGVDVSTGDAFVIPSVEFAFGNRWRVRAEADLFFAHDSRTSPTHLGQSTYALAGLNHNDQFLIRATYQF